MSEYEEIDSIGGRGNKSVAKLFHEELVLQWIVAHPSNTRPLVLKNAWFFFGILVRHSLPSHPHTLTSLTDQKHG